MEMRLCSKVDALFVEVCSFDDSSEELCVTATVRKGGREVILDFSFFIDILDDCLNFMIYDDGSWSVDYYYDSEQKSWLPDISRVSDSLVFDGLKLELIKQN